MPKRLAFEHRLARGRERTVQPQALRLFIQRKWPFTFFLDKA